MSCDDEGWGRCAGAICVVIAFLILAMLSNMSRDKMWERRLVDDPDSIAAIRSRVLAERAEAEQLGGR